MCHRHIAKEREDRSNRHAACIGSIFSSTWPAGGERLRTQGEHAAARRQQQEEEEEEEAWKRKELAKSPQLSPRSSRPASPLRSIVSLDPMLKPLQEPTQPAFIRQFSTKIVCTTPDVLSHKKLSDDSPAVARSVTGARIRMEGVTDQEPWKRVNKPRALKVQEQARVKVYCSQLQLFNGVKLQEGGVAIRPLHQLDLLQVVDGFKADATALARQRTQTKSEKTRDNSNPTNVKIGGDAAAGTNESDASANDWLQGLLDYPKNASELLEQLQKQNVAAIYSIVDVATDRSVGVISLGGNAPQSLRVEIASMVLPRSLSGSAVMVQTLHLLLEHIFEKIQYIRVQVSEIAAWCVCSILCRRLRDTLNRTDCHNSGFAGCDADVYVTCTTDEHLCVVTSCITVAAAGIQLRGHQKRSFAHKVDKVLSRPARLPHPRQRLGFQGQDRM